MDISMSKEELEQYLSQPLIARIATVGKNQSPNIHPIWFIFEDGVIIMSTGRDSAKIKSIKKNPNIAVAVDSTEGGFQSRGVVFRGHAELLEEDALELTKKIFTKYSA